MDASDGANKNGNGHHVPEPVSLPSAAAAPAGAPVPGTPPAPAAGAPDAARDPVTGKILPGQTLNKRGRTPGSTNLNTELMKAVKSFRIGSKSYLELFLTRSLQDVKYAELIAPKIFGNVDQPAAPGGINIHNAPSATASNSESYVDIAKLVTDPAGREFIAGLAERRAACRTVSGEPRHVRQ